MKPNPKAPQTDLKPRFPLYAKILLWFFINGLILLAVLAVSLRIFYDVRLDRMLWRGAEERLVPVTRLLTEELDQTPAAEWDAVLARYSTAYRVDFYLFGGEGLQIAGPTVELPAEIQERFDFRRSFRRRRSEMMERAMQAESSPVVSREPPPPSGGPRWEPPSFIQRTSNPRQFWVFDRIRLPSSEEERGSHLTLLLRSSSITGGGLWLDLTPLILTGLVSAGLSVLLWFPLVRGITRSLAQMTHASRRVAEGRFDVRVPTRRRDELGLLGQDINQMAQRLEGLVQGQKRFLGDVAHELCSPLARLQMALGILEQHAKDDQQSYMNSATENARLMADLVNELLSFSKAALGVAPLTVGPVSVSEALDKAVHRDAQPNIRVDLATDEGLCVLADPDLLGRALGNLLRNAVRYAGEAGPIRLTAQARGDAVDITVSDAGPGVPAEELARIFDPFFRLDPSRAAATGGAGLGLSIVKTCIESCGGTVSARNRAPHGLEVVLSLPAP